MLRHIHAYTPGITLRVCSAPLHQFLPCLIAQWPRPLGLEEIKNLIRLTDAIMQSWNQLFICLPSQFRLKAGRYDSNVSKKGLNSADRDVKPQLKKLTVSEIVQIHTSKPYSCCLSFNNTNLGSPGVCLILLILKRLNISESIQIRSP